MYVLSVLSTDWFPENIEIVVKNGTNAFQMIEKIGKYCILIMS